MGAGMELGLLILAVALAAGAFLQAFRARIQANRLARFLSSIERRIIWIEKDVSQRMIQNGLNPVDAQVLHDIRPPFEEAEREFREVIRPNKNPG